MITNDKQLETETEAFEQSLKVFFQGKSETSRKFLLEYHKEKKNALRDPSKDQQQINQGLKSTLMDLKQKLMDIEERVTMEHRSLNRIFETTLIDFDTKAINLKTHFFSQVRIFISKCPKLSFRSESCFKDFMRAFNRWR